MIAIKKTTKGECFGCGIDWKKRYLIRLGIMLNSASTTRVLLCRKCLIALRDRLNQKTKIEHTCRVCGCCEDDSMRSWVEEDLCSQCEPPEKKP